MASTTMTMACTRTTPPPNFYEAALPRARHPHPCHHAEKPSYPLETHKPRPPGCARRLQYYRSPHHHHPPTHVQSPYGDFRLRKRMP
jgi:hypothetical protein